MTETNTTSSPQPGAGSTPPEASPGRPVFPPGRYGRRREPGRFKPTYVAPGYVAPGRRRFDRAALVVLTVVVVAIGAVAAGILSQQYGPGRPYDVTVERYYDITDSQVVVEFSVVVPGDEAAICAVRARNADGAEVGREQVRVTSDGERRTWVAHTLVTSELPVAGEVQRCWRDR